MRKVNKVENFVPKKDVVIILNEVIKDMSKTDIYNNAVREYGLKYIQEKYGDFAVNTILEKIKTLQP